MLAGCPFLVYIPLYLLFLASIRFLFPLVSYHLFVLFNSLFLLLYPLTIPKSNPIPSSLSSPKKITTYYSPQASHQATVSAQPYPPLTPYSHPLSFAPPFPFPSPPSSHNPLAPNSSPESEPFAAAAAEVGIDFGLDIDIALHKVHEYRSSRISAVATGVGEVLGIVGIEVGSRGVDLGIWIGVEIEVVGGICFGVGIEIWIFLSLL